MTTASRNNKSFTLTAEDKSRLQKIAPWFDIDFRKLDGKNYVMRAAAGGTPQTVELPAATAHRRLLAEICGKSSKWVHFHFAVSCRDSLLGRSDSDLERLALLYARDRNAAFDRALVKSDFLRFGASAFAHCGCKALPSKSPK